MEVTVQLFVFLILLAFICEFIDASLGMGYGTILTPVLIIIGFNPLTAVPAVLLSQAMGGFTASIFHHQFKNADFTSESKDLKIVFIISSFGVGATILAAIISVNIPKIIIKTYIGVLVLVIGFIILRNYNFKFSWKKIMLLSILGAFNKGFSGGGFGPVITAGQVLSGQKHKRAIGATTFAEAPICITAFFTYIIGRSIVEIDTSVWHYPVKDFFLVMFSKNIVHWELIIALILGSVLVAPFGAFTTKQLNDKKMHLILGSIIIVLGITTLYKTFA